MNSRQFYQITVIDVSGRIHTFKSYSEYLIRMSGFPRGTYTAYKTIICANCKQNHHFICTQFNNNRKYCSDKCRLEYYRTNTPKMQNVVVWKAKELN